MTRRLRLGLQVVICVVCLVLPGQLARDLGLPEASGLLSLASLAALVACVRVGWRQALGGSLALALLSIPGVLSQANAVAATALMAVTAGLLGLASRWQQQPAYWLLVVSLCLLITTLPLPQPVSAGLLAKLAGLLLLSCGLTTLVQGWFMSLVPASAQPAMAVQHSWMRSLAYGALLAVTALLTTPIAMAYHWHMTGLWLILTPFLVLRPYVKDGWKPTLHRALGTIAGVLLVHLLALTLPPTLPLQIPAIALGIATALVAVRHGHQALFVLLLTATIVLFDSNDNTLLLMADKRLQANAIGIAIAIGVMAVADPIERSLLRRQRA
ncbi:MAG: Fusaric acid resistance protein-like [Cyanobacteriota bacterium]